MQTLKIHYRICESIRALIAFTLSHAYAQSMVPGHFLFLVFILFGLSFACFCYQLPVVNCCSVLWLCCWFWWIAAKSNDNVYEQIITSNLMNEQIFHNQISRFYFYAALRYLCSSWVKQFHLCAFYFLSLLNLCVRATILPILHVALAVSQSDSEFASMRSSRQHIEDLAVVCFQQRYNDGIAEPEREREFMAFYKHHKINGLRYKDKWTVRKFRCAETQFQAG